MRELSRLLSRFARTVDAAPIALRSSAAAPQADVATQLTLVTHADEPFPQAAPADTLFGFTLRGITLELPRWLLTSDLWRAFCLQYYEGSEFEALQAAIRPDDTVLELGGGVGFISTHLMKHLGAKRVVAVEADPRLIPVIHRTHRLNDVAVEVLNYVAARRNGTVLFNEQEAFWASSVVLLPDSRQVRLPSCDVQGLITTIRPDVVVVDIEGGESTLFDGIKLVGVRHLIVEVHQPQIGFPGIAACMAHLARAGFTYDPAGSGRTNVMFSRFRA